MTLPIAADTVLKMDTTSDYKIRMTPFYLNADACQRDHPNFDGAIQSDNLPTDGSLPSCFFNLPVIKGNYSPCDILGRGPDPPAVLNINTNTCTDPNWCKPRDPACQ
jgi:hypothetical protein